MIKNSILYYGMPLTGKSTRLQKIYLNTLKQSHGYNRDVVVNLWEYTHRSKKWAKRGTTSNYIQSPHGVILAIPITFNPNGWLKSLTAFHQKYPNAPHILLDECYCVNAVYLDALIMCCRDLWPHAQVVMGSIDYDSWHQKLPTIDAFINMAQKSVHLNHKCMLCHKRIATRRLHIIKEGKSTWKPYYNPVKYINKISNPKIRRKANMLSVCPSHYDISVSNLNYMIKKNKQDNFKKYHSINKPTWHFSLVYHRNK